MKNALEAGEFVEAVLLPTQRAGAALRCYKLGKRYDQDISAVCAAFSLRLDGDTVSDVRIALGGMAATPKRARATEDFLRGESWDETTLITAQQMLARDFTPLSDMRASADYRRRAAANLLHRFYLETRPGHELDAASVNVFAVAH